MLDTAGYIEREIDIRDLRRRRIWISWNGQQIVEEAAERLNGVDAAWLRALDPRDRRIFAAALRLLPPALTARNQWTTAM